MLFDMVYVPITCMAALQLNFKTMGPLVPQYAQVTTSLSLSKILEEDFLSHSETASPAMQNQRDIELTRSNSSNK